jgi:hypothetical protein
LIWFKNYLSGRKQFVFVNNELSDSGLVKAGVPQGSVLGTLLSQNIKIVDNGSSKF